MVLYMHKVIYRKSKTIPTPVAGLALGIASLGWCMENALSLNGLGQNAGAVIASIILIALSFRFVFHPDTLLNDIQHPVIGSIIPTYAMAIMVISKAIGNYKPELGAQIWMIAIGIHILALIFFIYYRAKEPLLHHLVPSWFVPPVGLIVADVSCPNENYYIIALILLSLGMTCYLFMLPLVVYRFMFRGEIPDTAKPTIAIMAAPASLSLAGYLSVVQEPSGLVLAILLGVALLMTLIIYCAFYKLLKLPFSPGYSAFTFPMAIGATALYKLSDLMSQYHSTFYISQQVRVMANIELLIAFMVVIYVSFRYIYHYFFNPKIIHANTPKKTEL